MNILKIVPKKKKKKYNIYLLCKNSLLKDLFNFKLVLLSFCKISKIFEFFEFNESCFFITT